MFDLVQLTAIKQLARISPAFSFENKTHFSHTNGETLGAEITQDLYAWDCSSIL